MLTCPLAPTWKTPSGKLLLFACRSVVDALGIWLKLMLLACISNVLPIKMSLSLLVKTLLLAKFEGEVFGAVPKSCGCVKNCSKFLPSSTFCDVKKLMLDVCETGTGMLLGLSAILPEFSKFLDVDGWMDGPPLIPH